MRSQQRFQRLLFWILRLKIAEFERLWKERAEEGRSKLNWTTTDVDSKGGGADEESLSPGSVVRVALEERFKFVDVYTTINGDSIMGASSKSQLQHKLYKLLINVCLKDDGTKVNPVAIKEAAYHLPYLILELHNNLTFVGNVLQWEEIGFVVQIRGQKNKVVKKHFAINLHSKRFQRSPPGGGSARHKDDFPD